MKQKDLQHQDAVRTWIEDAAPDPEFATELCVFINDYGEFGGGVAGADVVTSLEGLARVLRGLGWSAP